MNRSDEMTCAEALELLYDIIDREASEIDAKKVEEHLKHCSDCSDKYRVAEAFQEFLVEKVNNGDTLSKVDKLKAKILSQLDDIDSGGGGVLKGRPFELAAKTLVAAASLAILIGAALITGDFYSHFRNYMPLEQAHLNVIEAPAEFAGSKPVSHVQTYIHDDLDYEIEENVGDYRLIGGSTVDFNDVQAAHFLYRADEILVSVFVIPASEYAIPDELEESSVVKNGVTFFDHHCRGCHLIYHQMGSAVVVVASTDHTLELLDFIPGHAIA